MEWRVRSECLEEVGLKRERKKNEGWKWEGIQSGSCTVRGTEYIFDQLQLGLSAAIELDALVSSSSVRLTFVLRLLRIRSLLGGACSH